MQNKRRTKCRGSEAERGDFLGGKGKKNVRGAPCWVIYQGEMSICKKKCVFLQIVLLKARQCSWVLFSMRRSSADFAEPKDARNALQLE